MEDNFFYYIKNNINSFINFCIIQKIKINSNVHIYNLFINENNKIALKDKK